MKCMKNQESGRSMIEMIGVLAVTGLLTAGAFVLIQSGMASQKRNRATDEINALVSNVRSLTAEAENFNKLGGSVNKCAGLGTLPVVPVSSDAQATNAKALLKTDGMTPFGNGSFYAVSGSDNYFTIWLVDIGDECATMKLRSYTGACATECIESGKANWALAITYTK